MFALLLILTSVHFLPHRFGKVWANLTSLVFSGCVEWDWRVHLSCRCGPPKVGATLRDGTSRDEIESTVHFKFHSALNFQTVQMFIYRSQKRPETWLIMIVQYLCAIFVSTIVYNIWKHNCNWTNGNVEMYLRNMFLFVHLCCFVWVLSIYVIYLFTIIYSHVSGKGYSATRSDQAVAQTLLNVLPSLCRST